MASERQVVVPLYLSDEEHERREQEYERRLGADPRLQVKGELFRAVALCVIGRWRGKRTLRDRVMLAIVDRAPFRHYADGDFLLNYAVAYRNELVAAAAEIRSTAGGLLQGDREFFQLLRAVSPVTFEAIFWHAGALAIAEDLPGPDELERRRLRAMAAKVGLAPEDTKEIEDLLIRGGRRVH